MKRWGCLLLVLLMAVIVALPACAPVGAQAGVGESPLPTPPGAVVDVPQVELSGTGIAALVAVISSVVMAYIPGATGWWQAFGYKREVLGAGGLVVALALVILHYAGAVDLGLPGFGWPVVWRVLEAWLAFSGAGQLAFTAQHAVTSRAG